IGRVLHVPPDREPVERLRVAPEPCRREPRRPGGTVRAGAADVRRRRPAARLVGRLSRAARRVRVLAGEAEPVARPVEIFEGGQGVDEREAGALTRSKVKGQRSGTGTGTGTSRKRA